MQHSFDVKMPRDVPPLKKQENWQYKPLPESQFPDSDDQRMGGRPELPTEITIHPLPEEASGFRKKKDASSCVPSACVPALTVGDVRRCMTQIRRAGRHLRTEHLLCCGWPAGYFALSYIIGHYMNRRTKYGPDEDGKRKRHEEEDEDEEEEDEDEDEEEHEQQRKPTRKHDSPPRKHDRKGPVQDDNNGGETEHSKVRKVKFTAPPPKKVHKKHGHAHEDAGSSSD